MAKSMNDKLLVHLRCPACGKTCCRDVVFNFSLKCRCWSSNDVYRVGDRIKGFPPIPLFEAQGSADFACCKAMPDGDAIPDTCVVQVAFGWIVKVVYPTPEDWEWEPLPVGRNTRRRKAVADELYRREFEEWRAQRIRMNMTPIGAQVARGLGIAIPGPAMEKIAFALYQPLRVNLDYDGIGRELVRDVEWPENYAKDRNGKWFRRKSRPI